MDCEFAPHKPPRSVENSTHTALFEDKLIFSLKLITNQTTLDTIEKAEKGIGLNGQFESVDEMLKALKDGS